MKLLADQERRRSLISYLYMIADDITPYAADRRSDDLGEIIERRPFAGLCCSAVSRGRDLGAHIWMTW